MRQISASKRSQNVVEIAKTDYCGFGQYSLLLYHIRQYLAIEKGPAGMVASKSVKTKL